MTAKSVRVDVSERRVFTVEDKRRIVGEYRAAGTPFDRGELLRREGLYQSHVWKWGVQVDDGTLGTLRRGPAPLGRDPVKDRVRELHDQLDKAKAKIVALESLVTAQGKCLALHVEVRLDVSANSPKH